jgi:CDP-diacylglycerol--glycerol-3-phosphate 3-phosphatidyltransferase
MTPTPEKGQDSPEFDLQLTSAPNLLTLTRIVMVPIVVGLLFQKTATCDLIAALLFAAASITDYFDGYLARTRQAVTVVGKLMDPLADKFLVVSALVMLQEMGRIHPILVILLICREMAISVLRALASSEGLTIGSSRAGKWKTATQMVAIPLLIAQNPLFGIPIYPLGQALIWISLAISLGSLWEYTVDFFKSLRLSRARGGNKNR